MSFLPAVRRQISSRAAGDKVKITLEYLLRYGVGKENPVSLKRLVTHLKRRGVKISEPGFQQTILAESRGADYFIGSGPKGYFLIDSENDAIEMAKFYEHRIQAEKQNLKNLKRQARACSWSI
jgi:hypothetical protein